jgi:hypothetical protein
VPIASGANSVASALGNRTRRDPGTAVRTYHRDRTPAPKTGTSYLAGNRNFLSGPDRLVFSGVFRLSVFRVSDVLALYRKRPGAEVPRRDHGSSPGRFRYSHLKGAARVCGRRGPDYGN